MVATVSRAPTRLTLGECGLTEEEEESATPLVLQRPGHEASDALVAQSQFVLLLLRREDGVDEIERRAARPIIEKPTTTACDQRHGTLLMRSNR
jgi:hypothetical protein